MREVTSSLEIVGSRCEIHATHSADISTLRRLATPRVVRHANDESLQLDAWDARLFLSSADLLQDEQGRGAGNGIYPDGDALYTIMLHNAGACYTVNIDGSTEGDGGDGGGGGGRGGAAAAAAEATTTTAEERELDRERWRDLRALELAAVAEAAAAAAAAASEVTKEKQRKIAARKAKLVQWKTQHAAEADTAPTAAPTSAPAPTSASASAPAVAVAVAPAAATRQVRSDDVARRGRIIALVARRVARHEPAMAEKLELALRRRGALQPRLAFLRPDSGAAHGVWRRALAKARAAAATAAAEKVRVHVISDV